MADKAKLRSPICSTFEVLVVRCAGTHYSENNVLVTFLVTNADCRYDSFVAISLIC